MYLRIYPRRIALGLPTLVITVFILLTLKDLIIKIFFSSINLGDSVYRILPQLENGVTCRIPNIDPFDKKAINLILKDERGINKPNCIENHSAKFYTDGENLIMLNHDSTYWKSVLCCYIGYYLAKYSGSLVEAKNCEQITSHSTKIPTKFSLINVKCHRLISKSIDYEDQFLFYRIKSSSKMEFDVDPALAMPNIIFVGLDTVSRQNFIRFLPKTRHYLVEKLSAIEFYGVNKVSSGTQGNLLPMLTGCSLAEPGPNPASFPCELIWRKFKGYTVIRTEDDTSLKNEFYPTLKPDRQGSPGSDEDWLPFITKISLLNKNFKGDHFVYGCYQHQWIQKMLTDRIVKVAEEFEKTKRPYFHFIWSATTTHDVISFSKYMDEPLHNLLLQLYTRHLLNNTILILLSDHGMLFGSYSRKTNEGSIEARMPFLYFVLPEWFQDKYSVAIENMKSNKMKLTTPFDIHETLNDLRDFKLISNDELINSTKMSYKKGISLFKEIPLNRTCESAGIPENWCICYTKTDVNRPDRKPDIIKSVKLALVELNKQLKSFPVCRELNLRSVEVARKISTLFDDKVSYEIVFDTWPGDGMFQVTTAVEDKQYKMIGDIVRVNAYGKSGACLDEFKYVPKFVQSACHCLKV